MSKKITILLFIIPVLFCFIVEKLGFFAIADKPNFFIIKGNKLSDILLKKSHIDLNKNDLNILACLFQENLEKEEIIATVYLSRLNVVNPFYNDSQEDDYESFFYTLELSNNAKFRFICMPPNYKLRLFAYQKEWGFLQNNCYISEEMYSFLERKSNEK